MKLKKWDVIAYPVFIVVCIKVFLYIAKTGFIDGWEGNSFSLFTKLGMSNIIYFGLAIVLIIIASIKYHKQV